MRTHHCLTAFLCGAFLLGAGMAQAQTPPGTAGYAQFPPNAVIDPSAVQPGYTYPYPAVSPFDHAFESTYNDHGLWITDRNDDRNTKAAVSIEWLYAVIGGPESDPVSYDERSIPQAFFDNGDMAILNDGSQIRLPLTINPLANQYNNGRGAYSPFDSGLLDSSQSSGLRLTLNIERPDGVGFEMGGFGIWPSLVAKETGVPILRIGPEGPNTGGINYTMDMIYGQPSKQIYDITALTGLTSGPFNNITTDWVDMDSVGIFNPGIRLFDGSNLGTIQRFDAYMRTELHSQLFGAHVNILHSASRQIGPFTVRPLFGARYIVSKELFRVEGHDSGTDYMVDFDNLNTSDPTQRNALLPGGAEDLGTPIRDPYRAYIDSTTSTNLAGPEVGWNYAAGGKLFELVGETRIGLMGASTSSRLRTKGIGQPYLIDDTDFGGANPLYQPFHITYDKKSTSYVTPTFQQSFNTSTQPFAYIPILRSNRLMRDAKLKAGWTFLLIGQMQRPNEQIVYQSGNGVLNDQFVADHPNYLLYPTGDPNLKPEVKTDRSVYLVNYFNLGIEWDF